ncbi:predicted protein [Naegleria gruberi]|uniref:Predicted protein n=1 Tax=Naegleria gruberi TaxID=5762 RepID=D2V1M4_NAEGR|nr:uncharacterized protein NAEGRDRAFT_45922 [Naegleria gruberi]EFC49185.1 predicted protein [Naegleria gruberi]|eukprot:XP_002681929.1 predicted protein [Naegleria gruberi strain NEG-M]
MSTAGSHRSLSAMSKESAVGTTSGSNSKQSSQANLKQSKSQRSIISVKTIPSIISTSGDKTNGENDEGELDRTTSISTVGFEDSLEIITENGATALDALFTKIRNSIYLDYSEERNRVRFRNQFMNHVRDVYRKMILKEDCKIPRIEKLEEEGNWSGGAALEIKSTLFADIEYNLTREIESNKLLRDPKPVELPANIFGVNAYSNIITKSIPLASFGNLIHLGLGYNRLTDLSFLNECEQLASLDVSFNDLDNLESTIGILSKLPKLMSLNMQGNCFCMFDSYRGAVLTNVPQIKLLDNDELNEDQRRRYMELFKGFEGEKKPVSFYVERIVSNIQEDDETNRTEFSRDLLGILIAKFDLLWERGFTLPDPIPDEDESSKTGDELKALMKNQWEQKNKLQNDISTESQSNLSLGVSITLPSEIWDNYEKDWKDPKKRKQARANTLKANQQKRPTSNTPKK